MDMLQIQQLPLRNSGIFVAGVAGVAGFASGVAADFNKIPLSMGYATEDQWGTS